MVAQRVEYNLEIRDQVTTVLPSLKFADDNGIYYVFAFTSTKVFMNSTSDTSLSRAEAFHLRIYKLTANNSANPGLQRNKVI